MVSFYYNHYERSGHHYPSVDRVFRMKKLSFTIEWEEIIDSIQTEVCVWAYPSNHEEKKDGMRCIWDTGATNSCISKRVVNMLGLLSNGKERVYTA